MRDPPEGVGGHGKNQAHGCADTAGTFDFNVRSVALDHAVHHGQSQTGATLTFGGEERLEALAAGVIIHANTSVNYFKDDMRRAGVICEA